MTLSQELKESYPLQSKEFESWLWINYKLSITNFSSLEPECQMGYYIVFISYKESLITDTLNDTLIHKVFQNILLNFSSLEVSKLQLSN